MLIDTKLGNNKNVMIHLQCNRKIIELYYCIIGVTLYYF